MKFCTDIDGPQRTSPTDFGDLLTFPEMPPWGWYFLMKNLNNYEMDCHQI